MKSKYLHLCAASLCIFLAGCPGGASVHTDYDHQANFSQFRTYSFGHVRTDNPLYEPRIRDEVARDLQAKGLHQATSGTGDLVVTAVGAVHNRKEYQTFYDDPGFGYYYGGFGPGYGLGYGGGLGYSNTRVVNYKVGTLVLDMYNAQSKQLVWRGVARRGTSEHAGENTEHLNEAIDKMLDKYPPSAS